MLSSEVQDLLIKRREGHLRSVCPDGELAGLFAVNLNFDSSMTQLMRDNPALEQGLVNLLGFGVIDRPP